MLRRKKEKKEPLLEGFCRTYILARRQRRFCPTILDYYYQPAVRVPLTIIRVGGELAFHYRRKLPRVLREYIYAIYAESL